MPALNIRDMLKTFHTPISQAEIWSPPASSGPAVFGLWAEYAAWMPDPAGNEQLFNLKPLHVLLVGAGVLGSGILLTGSLSYRQAGKELSAEGIDANLRRRILPHAVKALGGSLLLTGAAAAGCFWVMQNMGLVSSDNPTSSRTLATAWDMMLRPQAVAQQQAQQQAQQKLDQQQP